MKNAVVLKTWLVAGILVLATGLEAQPRMGQRQARMKQRPARTFIDPGPGGILMVLKARQQELNVTDEQIARIEELQGRLEEQAVEHRNAMNTQRLKLKQGLRDKENRDFDTLKAQLMQNAQSRIDFQIARMKLRAEIADVLTDDQKAALKAAGGLGIRRGRGMLRDRAPRMSTRGHMSRQAPRIRRFRRTPEDIR